MSWSFRKSKSLGGGFRLNMSKSGPGISWGTKGFRLGIGPRGVTRSASIPGTGIYNRKTTSFEKKTQGPSNNAEQNSISDGQAGSILKSKKGCGCLAILVVVFIIICAITQCGKNNSGISSDPSSETSSETLSSQSYSQYIFQDSTTAAATTTTSISSAETTSVKQEATSATQQSNIKLISITSPVSLGSKATVTIQGQPNTKYSIAVHYSSGDSTAAGLEDKTSDSSGKVSWTWKIGPKTKTGTFNIDITGADQTFSTEITIQK